MTCASLAAWGQETENPDEGTTEKVMHKVYTNTWGNIGINAPETVEDGATLTFSLEKGDIVYNVMAYYNGMHEQPNWQDNNTLTLENVKTDVLLFAFENKVVTIDGVQFSIDEGYGSETAAYLYAGQPESNEVVVKNVIEVDGSIYPMRDYNGAFNEYDNITSITFPNTPIMIVSCEQKGLKEIHLKALNPENYYSAGFGSMDLAFGDMDLSQITLFVPEGTEDVYGQMSPWNKFKIETEEAPTEFPVYVIGQGIEDYYPKTATKGEDLEVTVTFKDGYSPMDLPSWKNVPDNYPDEEGQMSYYIPGEEVNCDQMIRVGGVTNLTYTENEITYRLPISGFETNIVENTLPSDTEELVIPEFITTSEGNTYRVAEVLDWTFKNLTSLKKLTIEGDVYIRNAFEGSTALEEIHCKSETLQFGRVTFPTEILSTCIVYVPKGCVDVYKNSGWGIFENIVEEGSAVEHTVTYELTNLSFASKEDSIMSVVRGDSLTFTLVPDSAYRLPDSIVVSGAESYTYDPSTGAVEISSVMSDLTIAASAVAPVDTIWCGVSYELENLLLSDSIMRVAMGDTLAFSLIPVDSTYVLPDTISVSGAESYTYDPSTGVVAVPSVMTDVAIKASALKLQNDTIQTDSIVSGQWQEIVIGEKLETASGDTITEVSLNNVTSKVLTVSSEASTILNLSGTNDLGTVTNDGTLVIQKEESATLAPTTTVTNNGVLRDSTGLVTSVEGSAALAVEPLEDVEVKEGSSVELTASASADVRPEFQWQKLENEVWVNVEDGGVVASSAKIMTRASTTYTDKLSVSSENAGSYRCLITRSVSTEEGDGEEGTETVTASTTLAVYAEVTVGSASDEDDDDPVQGGDTGDDDDPVIPDPEPTPEPTPDPDPIQYGVSALPCSGAEIKLSAQFVEEGGTLTFTIEIEEGYVADEMIVKVSQGIGKAVEVKPDAKGVYTIKNVDGLVTITVEGVKEATATDIENVEGVQVYSHEGAIYVYTPTEARVMIVAMNGVLKANEEQIGKRRYELPRGFYVVWVEGESFKVAN